MPARSKSLERREPSGRISRTLERLVDAHSPALAKRLRDAALRGMAAPEWGTEIGRLFMAGRLTEQQWEAGNRFANLVRQFRIAIDAPPEFPILSVVLRSPMSFELQEPKTKQAKEVVRAYEDAVATLHAAVGKGWHMVLLICERDAAVGSFENLRILGVALTALAAHWRIAS